ISEDVDRSSGIEGSDQIFTSIVIEGQEARALYARAHCPKSLPDWPPGGEACRNKQTSFDVGLPFRYGEGNPVRESVSLFKQTKWQQGLCEFVAPCPRIEVGRDVYERVRGRISEMTSIQSWQSHTGSDCRA